MKTLIIIILCGIAFRFSWMVITRLRDHLAEREKQGIKLYRKLRKETETREER